MNPPFATDDVSACDPDPEVDPRVMFTCPQAKDTVDKAHSKVAFQHDRGGHVNRLLFFMS